MKKIVIIVSAIMLSWTVGLADPGIYPIEGNETNTARNETEETDPLDCPNESVSENTPENAFEPSLTETTPQKSSVDFVPYILGCIILGLLGLLFFLYQKIRANKKEIAHNQEGKEYYKSKCMELESRLASVQNNLSVENKRLKDEIERLRTEIYQTRQKQKIGEEAKMQLAQQPQVLYADAIIDGKFNRVKEQPNADTIFELRLSKPGETRASVILYEGAYQLVKQRPEFLEGCEKQILGTTTVSILREGIAQKDGNGQWIITTTPEIEIK